MTPPKPDAWINQFADELHLAFERHPDADDSEPLYRSAFTVEQDVEQLREALSLARDAAWNLLSAHLVVAHALGAKEDGEG